MASARVFQIHELAQQIIRYTCSRSQPAAGLILQGGDTLAALARVNHLLSTIAIAEMWKVLHSGVPLVNLLPWDFDALVDPAIANKRMIKEIDRRGVTSQDLKPYMKYGRYVKAMNLEKEDPVICTMMEKADHLVVALGLNDRHFTNLRSLAVPSSHFLDFARYIKIRGGRAVEDLKIGLDSVSRGPWFEEMATSCVYITALTIASFDPSRTVKSVPSELIPVLDNFQQLRSLIMDIEGEQIRTLLPKVKNLPALKNLNLRIRERDTPEPSFEELHKKETKGAQQFLHLGYYGCFGETLHTILKLSRLLSIFYTRIKCVISPVTRPGEMETVLGWVQSSQPGIRALIFLDKKKPYQNILDDALGRNINPRLQLATPASTLRQLGGLRGLQYLALTTFGGETLTPEALNTLAVSFSCLVTCIFGIYKIHDQGGNPCCGIKILDIVKFAAKCSRLHTLVVYFDARKPEDLDMDSNGIVDGESRLTRLEVGSSLIDDAEYVAEILHNSLPKLRCVMPSGLVGIHRSLLLTEAEIELWKEVHRILCLKRRR